MASWTQEESDERWFRDAYIDYDEHRGFHLVEEDSDQDCPPTKTCVLWGCDGAALQAQDGFYVCPSCKASYGRHPHPDLPPADPDRIDYPDPERR